MTRLTKDKAQYPCQDFVISVDSQMSHFSHRRVFLRISVMKKGNQHSQWPLWTGGPPGLFCLWWINGDVEATGLGFVCFVVINPRVLSELNLGSFCNKYYPILPLPPRYDGSEGYVEAHCPCFAIAFKDGRIQIMRFEMDESRAGKWNAPTLFEIHGIFTICSWVYLWFLVYLAFVPGFICDSWYIYRFLLCHF